MLPHEIEEKSFEIIAEEAGEHSFSNDEWAIVARMIHTTADFEYLDITRIHPRAIEAGIKVLQEGGTIFTDTNMARVGINLAGLAKFGCQAVCLMSDPEVAEKAKKNNTTRAHVAVDEAVSRMNGGIYIVGNAQTALLRLVELITEGKASPELVIGLPVGFVNAAESKEELLKTDVPYITNVGRKGGSNLAAAVVNALMRIASARETKS